MVTTAAEEERKIFDTILVWNLLDDKPTDLHKPIKVHIQCIVMTSHLMMKPLSYPYPGDVQCIVIK
jgi:hypothetical protein